MSKTPEEQILHIVATCNREEAMRQIGDLMSHEFDKSFGDLISSTTHRIRRTTKPVTLPYLTADVRELLESTGGKWFTTLGFIKLMGDKYPYEASDEHKVRLMKTSHALSAMYRAGLLEQRVLSQPEHTAARFVGAWARGYRQTTVWRWFPQHEIELLTGEKPEKVKIVKW